MSRKIAFLCSVVAFLVPIRTLASGWVKTEKNFYSKLSYSQADGKNSVLPGTAYEEVELAWGLYGEYGLDILPVKSHIWAYLARKSLTRRETLAPKTEYEGAALTDTQVVLKMELFDLAKKTDEYPFNLLIAANAGLQLPTTPEKFALGNEHLREGDVPASKNYLLGTIDKGSTGLIIGIGVTVFWRGIWANLGFDRVQDLGDKWHDQKTICSIGGGLPYNSWIQATYSHHGSEIVGAGTNRLASDKNQQFGLGVGITVWQGLAFELEKTQHQNLSDHWDDWQSLSVGVSYRSL